MREEVIEGVYPVFERWLRFYGDQQQSDPSQDARHYEVRAEIQTQMAADGPKIRSVERILDEGKGPHDGIIWYAFVAWIDTFFALRKNALQFVWSDKPLERTEFKSTSAAEKYWLNVYEARESNKYECLELLWLLTRMGFRGSTKSDPESNSKFYHWFGDVDVMRLDNQSRTEQYGSLERLRDEEKLARKNHGRLNVKIHIPALNRVTTS